MMDVLLNHRTIRQYKDEPIDEALLNKILEAGTRASTTGNMQIYSIIVNRDEEMKKKIHGVLREHFKLEFLNRIDEIVVFKNLDKKTLSKIVDLELEKVQARLHNKDITLKVSNKVKRKLAEEGFDTTYGARPLKRIIQNKILDELSLEMVKGNVQEGNNVSIDLGKQNDVKVKVN